MYADTAVAFPVPGSLLTFRIRPSRFMTLLVSIKLLFCFLPPPHLLDAMGPFGLPEIIAIGVIVLLLFGAKLLPGLARGIGSIPSAFLRGKNSVNKDDSP